MTYIVSQKSGQTWVSKYVEEYSLKLSDTAVKAFISVILIALLRDNI